MIARHSTVRLRNDSELVNKENNEVGKSNAFSKALVTENLNWFGSSAQTNNVIKKNANRTIIDASLDATVTSPKRNNTV